MTKIVLKHPVTHDGKTYSEIEVDEPTVGALEAADDARNSGKGDMGATIAMLAHDAGMPAAALRKMRSSDFVRVSEALTPFVQAAAGEKPQEPSDDALPTLPTS